MPNYTEPILAFGLLYVVVATIFLGSMIALNYQTIKKYSLGKLLILWVALPYLFFKTLFLREIE